MYVRPVDDVDIVDSSLLGVQVFNSLTKNQLIVSSVLLSVTCLLLCPLII